MPWQRPDSSKSSSWLPEIHVPRNPSCRRLAEERELTIASVHGPFLVVTKNVWGMDPIEKIRRGIEMCTAFGARSLIVHPPYLWENAYARWIIEESAAYSLEHGVAVAVETMYPRWVAGRRLRGHRWLKPQELVDYCPHVALDTSHLTVAREDLLDSYTTLAPKLTHIHLSDNAGNGRDGHLELEQGVLPSNDSWRSCAGRNTQGLCRSSSRLTVTWSAPRNSPRC